MQGCKASEKSGSEPHFEVSEAEEKESNPRSIEDVISATVSQTEIIQNDACMSEMRGFNVVRWR